MKLEIRGIPVDGALRTRVATKLAAAVQGLPAPVTALATFFDDNGPKGGRAMRCALTVRRPGRADLRVEQTATAARRAFDEAVTVLERELAQERDRLRESRRRPKKYYAARRLLATGAAPLA
ncbi:MAG TPA: HPF/RaiA family ribosome-associated protein [Methylomirabilota bacterium]|jgi:ribosome-associated translation inhibitor RaiA|nr:HPF/RaiA family ribosome-associated protein [Methylomirabilota bacterium]